MEVVRLTHLSPPIPEKNLAVALGFFDGVHRGHAALLERTVSEARARGLSAAVLTFDSASSAYKSRTRRLSSTKERLAQFAAHGIDYVFLCDFEEMRNDSPAYFVKETLTGLCRAKLALCGFNFRFGAGAAGNAEMLTDLMRTCGGDTVVLSPMSLPDGTLISSSAIRKAIERGDMSYAADMLSRPFSLTAEVLHGKALGETLGFPTINQAFAPLSVIPAYGVYAVRVEIDGKHYHGVANVGVRPTVDGKNPNCETHIFDFSGDLYGKTATVIFDKHLRPELCFDSVASLKAQITKDKEEARAYYGN